jgi:Protein of unknown function (DUF2441)
VPRRSAIRQNDDLLLLLVDSHDVGSLVSPGNWFRAYNRQTFSATWTALVGELVFELVRREQFPMKPSRFHCLCLCTSESDLAEFRVKSGRLGEIGYEVELVNPKAQSHLGDWMLASVRPTDEVAEVARNALLYWAGTVTGNPELATASPIWITRRLKRRGRWRRRRSGMP